MSDPYKKHYERISKNQLRKVVADYGEIFADWGPAEEIAYFRAEGPIRQMVWFEALRTGAYRQICGISAIALPGVRMLPQMLDVRRRKTTLAQHRIVERTLLQR